MRHLSLCVSSPRRSREAACRCWALVLCVLAAVPRAAAAGTGGSTPDQVQERGELVMGTIARVVIDEGTGQGSAAFEAAFAAMREVDESMSLYRPTSELVRVNAHAAGHPERVGQGLFDLLVRARELSLESDGAFDVTVLPLLRLWGAYPELAYLGPGNRDAVGFAGLDLDAGSRTVSFRRAGMGIDLGGIAKGFAVDRARAALRAFGVHRARVDLGGMLGFLGAEPGGAWRVAVRDPDHRDLSLGVLALPADTAVSTSANYERDFVHEGWRAPSHMYDPRTGRPVRDPLAVTAWAPDATTADALSTALFVLGPGGAGPLLERERAAGALFVERDGAGLRTSLQGRPPLAWTVAVASAAGAPRHP